ncbi:hypothetical protein HU200_026456 [Digitaria exilis]|uniref:Uncharacterized protein n=1 Tax=Digitaria exilis TaxID=1010633 RepID=A0A835BV68_9POAL|nr:hypothetical protein HU200_026456 [Digitaria exilis]
MRHASILSEFWFAHLCSSDFSGRTSFRATYRHSHAAYIDLHASLVFQTLKTMWASMLQGQHLAKASGGAN